MTNVSLARDTSGAIDRYRNAGGMSPRLAHVPKATPDARDLGFSVAGRLPRILNIPDTVKTVFSRLHRGCLGGVPRGSGTLYVYRLGDGFIVTSRNARTAKNLVGTYTRGIEHADLMSDLVYANRAAAA